MLSFPFHFPFVHINFCSAFTQDVLNSCRQRNLVAFLLWSFFVSSFVVLTFAPVVWSALCVWNFWWCCNQSSKLTLSFSDTRFDPVCLLLLSFCCVLSRTGLLSCLFTTLHDWCLMFAIHVSCTCHVLSRAVGHHGNAHTHWRSRYFSHPARQ